MTDPRTTVASTPLPYGPFLTRTLPTLSRMFKVLNRYYVIPAIKAGLGPIHANPLTGTWMLLRTTGRRSGRPREVALGYAILDGAVYCSAGFGPRTQWYQNLLVDPRVEVILSGGGVRGHRRGRDRSSRARSSLARPHPLARRAWTGVRLRS